MTIAYEQREFDRSRHVCWGCWQEVSNKDFLDTTYHQTGKCRKAKRPFDKPKVRIHPSNNPALARVNYDVVSKVIGKPLPRTYAELCDWWGLPGRKEK